MSKNITTGQLARLAGVNIETIRYYERRKLIDEPPRPYGGYRYYPEHAVTQIRFIKSAQRLGFDLKEVGILMSIRSGRPGGYESVRNILRAKIQATNAELRTLKTRRLALQKILTRMREPRGVPDMHALYGLITKSFINA
ncbi:MerR family transcriptional regulator [bacterium]|nr:MerR family transcriptional regulator [bacterium]